jgi:DeoR/GlpR family transcriptional regulator of sugar metabolism
MFVFVYFSVGDTKHMLPAERQKAVLNKVARKGFASVADLAKDLSVSEMTVRRDLSELQKQGLLTRTWGGAGVAESAFFEVSLLAKVSQFVREKERIGKAAAEMVQNGDVVLLDSGSTTTQVARHLKDKRITVISNALNIASELLDRDQIEILVAGGVLRRGSLCLIGPQADVFFKDVHTDKLFLGVEGVDLKAGLTVPDIIEAHSKRAMVSSAQQVIVVADHSKLGRNTLGTIIPLAEADYLITGSEASEEVVEQLREHIAVVLV